MAKQMVNIIKRKKADPTEILLKKVFGEGEGNVITEWNVANAASDVFEKFTRYLPSIDYVIGPLNLDDDTSHNIERINQRHNQFKAIINEIKENGALQTELAFNPNPRCFLAIERETPPSRKHALGSIVNACAMGKCGIAVAMGTKELNLCARIVEYLHLLSDKNKIQLFHNNCIVIENKAFERILRANTASI